jgi:hypothetical protein
MSALPDSSAVDEALVQVLAADAALEGLVPEGVYWDIAPPNVRLFVSVSLVDSQDRWIFGAHEGEGEETLLYEVKVMTQDTTGEDALRAAAARVHQLLQVDGLGAIPGFECQSVLRQGRVRRTMVDPTSDVRYLQRGGRYQVVVQPLPAADPE